LQGLHGTGLKYDYKKICNGEINTIKEENKIKEEIEYNKLQERRI